MTAKTISHKVECLGRNKRREHVLEKPVVAEVFIKGSLSTISLEVKCPHAELAGDQKCRASGQAGVSCPYAINLPHAIDYYYVRR